MATQKRYPRIPEGEVKKCARLWLTEICDTVTLDKVETFRDILLSLVDVLEVQCNRISKSKKRNLGRPPGRYIAELEGWLEEFVGSDFTKWAATKAWIETFIAWLKAWPSEGDLPDWTKVEFIKSVRTLLRGKPGAHKKQAFIALVLELRARKLTSGQIARDALPELFEIHPEKATGRVKKVISRYGRQKSS